MTELNARAEKPMTRGDFETFLSQLAESRRVDPALWTNGSLDTFLDGVAGWLEDMDGYFENRGEPVPAEPSWQLFAQMLLAGRVYE